MYIYTLTHPSSDKIYVGKTNNPKRRFKDHLKETFNSFKCNWIKSLLSKNLEPVMTIIDTVSDEFWPQWERYWISFYRSQYGWNKVMNLTSGGDQGPIRKGSRLTQEQKEKIRLSYATGERNPGFGQQISDEVIVEIFRLNNQDGLSHKKIADKVGISQQHVTDILNKKVKFMLDSKWGSYTKKVNKVHRTDSEKKKISEFMRGNKFGAGRIDSEETKLKRSLANKGRMFTQEHKDKISQSMIESYKRKNTQPMENK